jgi:hypothetical protein
MAVLKVNQLTGLGRFRTLNRTALTPEAVHGLKLDERVRHLSSLVSGSGRGHYCDVSGHRADVCRDIVPRQLRPCGW